MAPPGVVPGGAVVPGRSGIGGSRRGTLRMMCPNSWPDRYPHLPGDAASAGPPLGEALKAGPLKQ